MNNKWICNKILSILYNLIIMLNFNKFNKKIKCFNKNYKLKLMNIRSKYKICKINMKIKKQ
jgi:hypothetical protein